ncbi:MAG TPA: pyridoxal-phosphate dependent enzyme [Planctomycetes bacterium]|nr:pyridoxal-phosphate dependent enzyme [Planctomycetota bacterium]
MDSRSSPPRLPVPIPLDAIERARDRLHAVHPPRAPLPARGPAFDSLPYRVHLACENLSPIGSFKLRGAGNAILALSPEELAGGLVTASAGNMAQGVAWHARRLGVRCTVIVPDTAPAGKLDAIERLGARVIRTTPERWWQVLTDRGDPEADGHFIHPVCDLEVLAGNATLGLELAESIEDLDAVLVPYGGGGLSSGIASALAARAPGVRVFAVEVEGRAPLHAALSAGGPVDIEPRESFVDGIGGRSVLAEMWPLASGLLAGSLLTDDGGAAEAIRVLANSVHVVAEGAGAAPVAVALARPEELASCRSIACVVSGGNLDAAKLARALLGRMP